MIGDGLPADLCAALTVFSRHPRILVASDYDGCIAPIVSRPADARPNPAAVSAVVSLAGLESTTAAVISGRSLADLTVTSGIAGDVHLVGSHGSEFGGDFGFNGFAEAITPRAERLLQDIVGELRSIAKDFAGTAVETKPASAVLHVRNTSRADDAEAALRRVRNGAALWDGVQATEGKAVIELAVIATDKGFAIHTLRERFNADAAMFIGDDVTDEKAFRRLGPTDVSIKVGEGDTIATHRIADPDQVAETLDYVLHQRIAALADN